MDKPFNKSKIISASEINRFLYCNHQWYYERYYGRQHIRNLYKEYFPNGDGSQPKIFERGNAFHNSYLSKSNRRLAIKVMVAISVILLIVLMIFATHWFYLRGA